MQLRSGIKSIQGAIYGWKYKMIRIQRETLEKMSLNDKANIALYSYYGVLLFSDDDQKKGV